MGEPNRRETPSRLYWNLGIRIWEHFHKVFLCAEDLLKKGEAKTEQIIQGSKLHPSTVRETLSKMHDQKLIYRKKIKNDSIGKNPYVYYPISPVQLLKRYSLEIEDKLNKIANLASLKTSKEKIKPFKIKIYEREDNEWILNL